MTNRFFILCSSKAVERFSLFYLMFSKVRDGIVICRLLRATSIIATKIIRLARDENFLRARTQLFHQNSMVKCFTIF